MPSPAAPALAIPGSGRSRSPIKLGRYVDASGAPTTVALDGDSDDPVLARHASRPWMLAFLRDKYGGQDAGGSGETGREDAPSEAFVSDDLLARHTLLCGGSGSGKTRLLLHLLTEQIRRGYSAVVIDPKRETLWRVLSAAQEAHITPEQVTLLLPGQDGSGCPAWNPLVPGPTGDSGRSGEDESRGGGSSHGGASLTSSVLSFVSVLSAGFDSWGPRLQDVLSNAAFLIAAHGMSLFELMRFLQDQHYRDAVVRWPIPGETLHRAGDRIACEEARAYFLSEFGGWGRAEQASAVSPVLNKIRALVNTPFLSALFCGRTRDQGGQASRLDFRSLWKGGRLLLVHLDPDALGADGARLLSGLLLNQLFSVAKRYGAKEGSLPVVLALDELGLSEKLSGGAVTTILAAAREYRLRLVAACQHLSQLSPPLRDALLTNTAVRVFFRLGSADAKPAADALAAGRGGQAKRLVIEGMRTRAGEPPATATWCHGVENGWGQALEHVPGAAVGGGGLEPLPDSLLGSNADYLPLAARRLRALAVLSGVPRVYVRDAATGTAVEAGNYAAGLGDSEVTLLEGRPLQLCVTFPRPRLKRTEQSSDEGMARAYFARLLSLPVRHALFWTAQTEREAGSTSGGGEDGGHPAPAPRTMEVVPVPDTDLARANAFAASIMRTEGDEDTLWATRAWRQQGVDAAKAGGVPQQQQKHQDYAANQEDATVTGPAPRRARRNTPLRRAPVAAITTGESSTAPLLLSQESSSPGAASLGAAAPVASPPTTVGLPVSGERADDGSIA